MTAARIELQACAECASHNPAEARFCMRCGAELPGAPADEQRPVWAGGLRFVTVLFCDLMNSTQAAQALEPDRWAAYLDGYFATASELLADRGGRVEKFIGDAVVGVFGLGAGSDVAAQDAVEAALGIVEGVADLAPPRQPDGSVVPIRVRVAVASGHVATAQRTSSFVIGPVLNRAARLQGAAPPDGTIVDMAAWLQVRELFATVELEPVPAKGFAAPLPAWLIHGDGSALAAVATVGRADVVAALRSTLIGGRAPTPTMRGLVGEAGVGKSRVISELAASLPDGWTCAILPCPRNGDQLGLLPMYQLLADVQRGPGTPSAVPARTARRAQGRGRGSAAERAAHHDRRELYEAIVVELTAPERPGRVLLVVDDSQTMSEPMGWFLTRLAEDRRLPGAQILVVGRHIPAHVRPQRTTWLPPLSPESSRALAVDLLQAQNGTADAAAVEGHAVLADPLAFVDVAEGNPLFIEQLVQLARFDTSADRQVPPSAHAAIGARADALGPAAQTMLAVLAVHSDAVTVEDLESLSGPVDLSPGVAELLGSGLLDAAAARTGSLRLASSLVAEVVIRRLTRLELHQLHRAIADHIAANLIHQPATVELLAHHRHQAYLTLPAEAHAAGPGPTAEDAREATSQAVEAWCLTARYAVSRGEFELARLAIRRAHETAGGDPVHRAGVLAIEAYVSGHAGDVEAALALAQAAHDARQPGVDVRAHLIELLAGRAWAAALPGYDQVIGLARASGDNEALVCAHLYAGVTLMQRGDYDNAHNWLNTALIHADVTLYCLGTAELYGNLGLAAVFSDAPAGSAVRTCSRIFRRANGSRLLSAASAVSLGLALHQAGRCEAAVRAVAWARDELTQLHHDIGVAQTLTIDAHFGARRGNWAAVVEARREQSRLYAALNAPDQAAISDLHAAVAAVAGGREVDPMVADALAAPPPQDAGTWEDAVLVDLARASAAIIRADWAAVSDAVGSLLRGLGSMRGAGARTVPLLTAVALLRHSPDRSLADRVGADLRAALAAKHDRGVHPSLVDGSG